MTVLIVFFILFAQKVGFTVENLGRFRKKINNNFYRDCAILYCFHNNAKAIMEVFSVTNLYFILQLYSKSNILLQEFITKLHSSCDLLWLEIDDAGYR